MSFIKYRFNAVKALNAILWLADRKPHITLHMIAKVLFYADKAHLNAFGRPIIGDEYTAMRYGPVPSGVYDILKKDPFYLEAIGADGYPFEVRGPYVEGKEKPDMSVFSDSDIEALETALTENRDLSFMALTEKSHKDPAWDRAPDRWMRYEDFLPDDDERPEKAEYLAETSHRMII